MNDTAPFKGTSVVVGPEEGQSYWQPLPSTGYVTVKVSPYTAPWDLFSSGVQVLEPGASIRAHAHERAHEMLFVWQGEGRATIDGVTHKIVNESAGEMKLLWVIFPAGLEDWFKAIGRPREPGATGPAPVFERPQDVGEIQRQQRFAKAR
jgi:hypothetical protein